MTERFRVRAVSGEGKTLSECQIEARGAEAVIRACEMNIFSRDFESRLHLLVEAHKAVEKYIAGLLLDFWIDRVLKEDWYPQFNVRLMTLLSTAKMYHDHRDSALKDLERRRIIQGADKIRELYSKQYDESFSYRLAEQLRNISQHAQTPIKDFHMQLYCFANEGGKSAIEYTLVPMLDVEKLLSRSDKLKANVREELKALGDDKLCIMQIIRDYLQNIVTAHLSVREGFEGIYRHSFDIVNDFLKKVEDVIPEEKRGKHYAVETDSGEFCVNVSLRSFLNREIERERYKNSTQFSLDRVLLMPEQKRRGADGTEADAAKQ